MKGLERLPLRIALFIHFIMATILLAKGLFCTDEENENEDLQFPCYKLQTRFQSSALSTFIFFPHILSFIWMAEDYLIDSVVKSLPSMYPQLMLLLIISLIIHILTIRISMETRRATPDFFIVLNFRRVTFKSHLESQQSFSVRIFLTSTCRPFLLFVSVDSKATLSITSNYSYNHD